MARRKGFLGRVFSRIVHPFRREEQLPPPAIPQVPPTPGLGSLRRQTLDHMMDVLPMVNATRTRDRIRYMTITELQWAIRATAEQLRWRARQDADRMHPVLNIPLNPFWYK